MSATLAVGVISARFAGRGGKETGDGARRSPRLTAVMVALLASLGLALSAPAQAAGTVNVLYAGSLVNLMERSIGPAFDQASADHFQGYAGGSKLLANQIEGKLRRADVFISAVPAVNQSLMGAANGNWVSWYIGFAHSPLVIGYNPNSRFAADFKAKPWYEVLQEPGIRIGRTDAKLDPKGALTVALMDKAQTFYKSPGLAQRVLGAAENSTQVLPEEELIGRLQSGQIDVGFFYSTETADAKIPAIVLPAEITPKAVYTVTIVHGAPNPEGGERFIAYLLGAQGRDLMTEHGLAIDTPALTGAASALPPGLRTIVAQTK